MQAEAKRIVWSEKHRANFARAMEDRRLRGEGLMPKEGRLVRLDAGFPRLPWLGRLIPAGFRLLREIRYNREEWLDDPAPSREGLKAEVKFDLYYGLLEITPGEGVVGEFARDACFCQAPIGELKESGVPCCHCGGTGILGAGR